MHMGVWRRSEDGLYNEKIKVKANSVTLSGGKGTYVEHLRGQCHAPWHRREFWDKGHTQIHKHVNQMRQWL